MKIRGLSANKADTVIVTCEELGICLHIWVELYHNLIQSLRVKKSRWHRHLFPSTFRRNRSGCQNDFIAYLSNRRLLISSAELVLAGIPDALVVRFIYPCDPRKLTVDVGMKCSCDNAGLLWSHRYIFGHCCIVTVWHRGGVHRQSDIELKCDFLRCLSHLLSRDRFYETSYEYGKVNTVSLVLFNGATRRHQLWLAGLCANVFTAPSFIGLLKWMPGSRLLHALRVITCLLTEVCICTLSYCMCTVFVGEMSGAQSFLRPLTIYTNVIRHLALRQYLIMIGINYNSCFLTLFMVPFYMV